LQLDTSPHPPQKMNFDEKSIQDKEFLFIEIKKWFVFIGGVTLWRHDTQHINTQHNNTQHNNTQQ
jgi:hypothetical protein